MRKLIITIHKLVRQCKEDHVNAFAAMSSYFILLSIIPILMILLLIVQYMPITQEDVLNLILRFVPSTSEFEHITRYLIDEVYNRSGVVLSISILVVLWSAGKGVMALTNGLNVIYRCKETRSYFYMRIRGTIYTIFLLVSIVICMLAITFGNQLQMLLIKAVPILEILNTYLVWMRTFIPAVLLLFVFLLSYTFLPNRKNKIDAQIPGAIVSTIAWMLYSLGISLYLKYGMNTYIYGSLTTVMLMLLWLYFCMYIILIGAEINVWIELKHQREKERFYKQEEKDETLYHSSRRDPLEYPGATSGKSGHRLK